jgi:hypothetical protein
MCGECSGASAGARALLCSLQKGSLVADLTGKKTTPWKYTGQSVPRGKPAIGTAAPAHPARDMESLARTVR